MPHRSLSKLISHSMLCAVLLVPMLSGAQVTGIPELGGEPASQVLSPSEERRIGEQSYWKVRSQKQFVTDSQINYYIQSLGDRLVNRNHLGSAQFTFFILDNPAINAFAAPGGYIGIFRGLIDILENESQLASVVAHEIAHVTQHHLARLYAKQADISLSTTAAIIAGVIAGTQGDGQAGIASIYTGIAASQQGRINFTRAHEQEADRIGMRLLANGKYDVNSMAATFTIMQRARVQKGDESLEFLRTHPLSSRRIAEAQAQAAGVSTLDKVIDSLEFQLIKARLDVLASDNLPGLQRRYQQRFTVSQTSRNTYALALIHQWLNTPEQAVQYIRKLETVAPESITVQLLKANNLVELGHLDKALLAYDDLWGTYPFHYPTLEAYNQALSRARHHRTASTLIQDYLLNASKPYSEAYKLLAFHLQQLDELSESRINMADYFLKTNEPDAAFAQLKLALREPGISTEEIQRINAKLNDVKQLRRYLKE